MIDRLNAAEIENLLTSQMLGRIGCHAGGVTYIVPISYAYDGSNIYAHSLEGMKLAMMRTNPSVCFEVEMMSDMANWRTVICQGIFKELADTSEKEKAFHLLVSRNISSPASETLKITPLWPFSDNEYAEVKGILFKITLVEKTGSYERSEKIGHYRV
jgi:nitroimidazol reductase NimA-like FMN-containing flavoprotein (pyridoxamine 5'-phosphate oxidase superfamily)